MGWFGYGLYDGDCTQTCHIDFIKWAIPYLRKDDVYDCLESRRTMLPEEYIKRFKKGAPIFLKKLRHPILRDGMNI